MVLIHYVYTESLFLNIKHLRNGLYSKPLLVECESCLEIKTCEQNDSDC